jgi:hypothetical protein
VVEALPYAALSVATLWALHHTRLACLIGNHAQPATVTADDPDEDLIHWQCPRCHKVHQQAILEPQWNNGNGTMYAERSDEALSAAE